MDLSQLDKILAQEPKFRAKQARQLIWRDLIEDWGEATTLPIELRNKLKAEAPLEIKAEIFAEKDEKSAKAIITLGDGLGVETVLMRHAGRNTVCVSSQVGCPLGCTFCATGKMGFERNLSSSEIVEQVLWWARWLKKNSAGHSEGEARRISRECEADIKSEILHRPLAVQDDKNKKGDDKKEDNGVHPVKSPTAVGVGEAEFDRVKVNNVVFMGMGEPFLNYDNVFEAIKILNDDNLLGIGARHISISTVGIVEGIERMAEDMPQINLAISLHAPDNELRQKLMPINKKYSLAAIMTAAKDYVAKTNRKLMFEYIMIKGVNDSLEQAKKLISLLDNKLFFVNLITYNPTGIFTPSEPAQVKKFKDILMKAGVQALERYRFGQEVKGACGQLTGKNKNL